MRSALSSLKPQTRHRAHCLWCRSGFLVVDPTTTTLETSHSPSPCRCWDSTYTWPRPLPFKKMVLGTWTREICCKLARRLFDYQMGSLDSSAHPIPVVVLWPFGELKPLTELRSRDLGGCGCKGRPVRKTDSITAICELIGKPRYLTNLWISTACYSSDSSMLLNKHVESYLCCHLFL